MAVGIVLGFTLGHGCRESSCSHIVGFLQNFHVACELLIPADPQLAVWKDFFKFGDSMAHGRLGLARLPLAFLGCGAVA